MSFSFIQISIFYTCILLSIEQIKLVFDEKLSKFNYLGFWQHSVGSWHLPFLSFQKFAWTFSWPFFCQHYLQPFPGSQWCPWNHHRQWFGFWQCRIWRDDRTIRKFENIGLFIVHLKLSFERFFFNADAHFISSRQMLLNVELRILNFPVRSEKETRGPIRCENM